MQSFWPHPKTLLEKLATAEDKTSPLEGKCLSKSVVYKATVKQENKKTNTYIGLTSNHFKNVSIPTIIPSKTLMSTKHH